MTRRSQLLELLRAAPGAQVAAGAYVDQGVADIEPFPFLAIVGHDEMKLALVLSVVNPAVGGVLLLGPRGTAKTTAVRSLTDLLPSVRRSLCPEGCTEERLDEGGMDAICARCAEKVGYGEPLTVVERVRLVYLPLNARLEDVVGGIDERMALEQQRVRLERGILAQANGHILYIDEVNMLDRAIADAILDAAAQGYYAVRRGPQKLTYESSFLLVGSMNPEEGKLRPQLMDRFGLRAVVRGLPEPEARYRAYERAMWHRRDPEGLAATFAEQTMALAEEIEVARHVLPDVTVPEAARSLALHLIAEMGIHSGRAEITLFEAARAHAAAAGRNAVTREDVAAVAYLSLRFRGGDTLTGFFTEQERVDARVRELLDGRVDDPS
jgi:magnesium chelatase subunit I